MKLSTKQTAYLRGLGQSLKPQLHLGHAGYTQGHLSALEDLFRGRELVKVRLLNTADAEPKEVAAQMAGAANAALVGVVGKTFVLYRPNPELKERIELPAAEGGQQSAVSGRQSVVGQPGLRRGRDR